MIWVWGSWWTWHPTAGLVCFGFGQVGFAVLAQLAPPPELDLSDGMLEEFIGRKWDDVEFPQERP